MKRRLKFLRDILSNIFLSRRYKLFYIAENFDWVIDEEGKTIIKVLSGTGLIAGKITSTPIGLRNKTLHFGSVGTLVTKRGIKKFHPSNKAVLSWFHIIDNDERVKFIPDLNERLSSFHTASVITRDKLVGYGADPLKITVIPLGVDRSIFFPDPEERKKIRLQLGISEHVFVIGSFQKDGDGWGEGMNPKLIKGPDIFCSTVKEIAASHPIHVILTGPARGYVKKRLEQDGVPYSHIYLKYAADVAAYYRALDLYLVCSREEGGPKAILESMATGVPVISTRVGMAPDVIKNGDNGILVDVADAGMIAAQAKELIAHMALRQAMAASALEKIGRYDSQKLAESFYYQIYKDLIE